MPQAQIIDGKTIAESVRDEITRRAAALLEESGKRPGLAVVLVGEDPASQVYVRNKDRAAEACGFHSVKHTLDAASSEEEVLSLVDQLNNDPEIHGILVQLPLPDHIDESKVLRLIRPEK
ncbi:MAG: tetrahydrofolate dehydrogenase/cyclohydrolase catalytic domain-containing protein, partial [Pseudomonadota bacterium]